MAKFAGKGIGMIIGIVVAILTIIPLFFKTFTVVVHQDQEAAHLWLGKASKHGMMMYPLRDFVRKIFRLRKLPRYEYEKVSGPGLSFFCPILGRRVILETQDRQSEWTRFTFYITMDELGYRLVFEGEAQVGWGIPAQSPVYPRVAVFNPDNFEVIVEGRIIDTICKAFPSAFKNGKLAEEDFQDSDKVFKLARRACKKMLRREYSVEFRYLNLRGVTPVPVQSEPIAAAIRTTAASGPSSISVFTGGFLPLMMSGNGRS